MGLHNVSLTDLALCRGHTSPCPSGFGWWGRRSGAFCSCCTLQRAGYAAYSPSSLCGLGSPGCTLVRETGGSWSDTNLGLCPFYRSAMFRAASRAASVATTASKVCRVVYAQRTKVRVPLKDRPCVSAAHQASFTTSVSRSAPLRVGINGFGRIGRLVVRAAQVRAECGYPDSVRSGQSSASFALL